MSLWWTGPDAASVNLEAPTAVPNSSQRVPRLMKTVTNNRFIHVACGGGHAMAITHDGRLFGWGWNAHGQCGLGDDVGSAIATPRAIGGLVGRKVAAVACGAAHTVALVDVYEERLLVFAWGAHHAGQLGHDDFAKKKLIASGKPFSVPSEVACVHGVAGKLFLGEEGGAPIGVVDGDGVRIRQPLSCGVAHTCLVSHDNVLWTWGANQHGQCGRTGHAESEVMAPGPVKALEAHAQVAGVACGGAHTLACSTEGKVFAFGLNATGQLGDGTDHSRPQAIPVPVRLQAGTMITSVACGEEMSVALSREGHVYTWGYGGVGQLGLGNLGSMRLPRQVTMPPADAVACGMGHAMAKTLTGELYTWGYMGTHQQAIARLEAQAAYDDAEAEREQERARARAEEAARRESQSEDKAREALSVEDDSGVAELDAFDHEDDDDADEEAAAIRIQASIRGRGARRQRGGGQGGGQGGGKGGGGDESDEEDHPLLAYGLAPQLLPMRVDLSGAAFDGPTGSGGGIAPLAASGVGAGRFFGVFLGEAVQPIPDDEAALLIQTTFRRADAKKQVKRRKEEEKAAAIIGGHATQYLAKRAMNSAALQREEDEKARAATRVQAHQRRRMEAAKAAKLKEEQQGKRDVVWATSAGAASAPSATAPKKPVPPSTKRVGGGFSKKTHRRAEANRGK